LTVTSTEPSELREVEKTEELLIKEAHEATRRRRLGWLTAFIIVALVVYLIVASTVGGLKPTRQIGGANTRPKGSALAILPCTVSSLRIAVQNGDGLSHGVELITFSNASGTSCRLSGYPVVKAILDSAEGSSNVVGMYAPAPAGTLKKAADTQYSWAGGVDVDDVPLKTFVAPTIILAAHTGVASSTLNWVDGPIDGGTCPAFNDLVIGVDGGSVTRFVRSYELLCYEFDVTPIVKGKTGSMFVKADYSKKANDLSDAKGSASGLRSEVATLHHEMEHPGTYSFSQRMQAAESVQQTSQNFIEHTPWPKLNSTLEAVSQEGYTFGVQSIVSLMQSGYSHDVANDYVKLLAGMKSLDEALTRLS
jgi:hypothetical protein